MGQVPPPIARSLPSSHHSERQSAAADLLMLDTDEFIDDLEKTLGRLARRKKAGEKKKRMAAIGRVF